jgi:hypothetical protein
VPGEIKSCLLPVGVIISISDFVHGKAPFEYLSIFRGHSSTPTINYDYVLSLLLLCVEMLHGFLYCARLVNISITCQQMNFSPLARGTRLPWNWSDEGTLLESVVRVGGTYCAIFLFSHDSAGLHAVVRPSMALPNGSGRSCCSWQGNPNDEYHRSVTSKVVCHTPVRLWEKRPSLLPPEHAAALQLRLSS